MRNLIYRLSRLQSYPEVEVQLKVFITVGLVALNHLPYFLEHTMLRLLWLDVRRIVSHWEHEVISTSLDLKRLNYRDFNSDRLPRQDIPNIYLMEVEAIFVLLQ